jgi:signal transduction histidine kinase
MNDLAMHILDILQNSLSALATFIKLTVFEDIDNDLLVITIEDNGKGMTPEQVSKLSDPFYTSRTTRKVGMGIPLLKQSAVQSGGGVDIESKPGVGTQVTASFKYSNIDRPPLGDVANAFILTVSANPDVDFILRYIVGKNEYVFDTVEVKEALEGTPLNDASIVRILTDMIRDNIEDLR